MEKDLVRVPVGDVMERQKSPLSMMPEGILDALPDSDIRDLIAYLRAKQQSPLAAEAGR